MTTFAPPFTPRYKARYKVGGIEHTLQARGPRGSTFVFMDQFAGYFHDLFQAFGTKLLTQHQWIDAQIALTDSDTFIPATLPAANTSGAEDPGDWSARARIRGLTISGQSTAGRARVTLFGIMYDDSAPGDIGADGIISAGEDASIATAVALLNLRWYSAGGVHAVFHNQATYKENDHLLKLVRKGTIT